MKIEKLTCKGKEKEQFDGQRSGRIDEENMTDGNSQAGMSGPSGNLELSEF